MNIRLRLGESLGTILLQICHGTFTNHFREKKGETIKMVPPLIFCNAH